MKKTLLLIAAAVLALTACGGPDPAPPSNGSAAGDQTVTGSGKPFSESGNTEASSEETSATGSMTAEELIAQLDWSQRAWYLEEVQQLLNQNQITYQGTWTISRERADLALEDGTTLVFLHTSDESGNDLGAELMMINDQFNDNGFQEHYLNQYDVTDSEEYYPETATRQLKQEELWRYNQTDLSIARNEIFARHGRKYQDPFLHAVFSRKSWYQPTYSGEEFGAIQDRVLNSYEKENLALLIQMEEDREFRKAAGADYQQPIPVVSGSWIDFDQDGKKEQLIYSTRENTSSSSEIFDLKVGTSEVRGSGLSLHQVPYIASLDGMTTQIIIQQDGPSDDPSADVYVYESGRLTNTGTIPGYSIQIYEDYITCMAQQDFFQTYQGMRTYEFVDGSILEVPEEFYEQNKEAVATATIPLYGEKGVPDISVTLEPGDKVIILGSDYKDWVLIQQQETGQEGWLRCGDSGDRFLCVLPNGSRVESWDLFEGLSFYG